jgi:hypothetical protein
MRITFVMPKPTLGGGSRIIAAYAKLLAERGHHVSIVATVHRASFKSRVRSWVSRRGKVLKPDMTYFQDIGDVSLSVVTVGSEGLQDRDVPDADVVVATWWETAEWVLKLSSSKGARAHLVQGHEVFPGQPVDRVRAVYRSKMKRIVVSKWLEGIMASEYGDHATTCILNCVAILRGLPAGA